MALFVSLGWLTETSSTYQVLQIFQMLSLLFTFPHCLFGSEEIKTRESLALALAGFYFIQR